MSDVHSAIGALGVGGAVAPGANMYLLAEVREVGLTDRDLCLILQRGYDDLRKEHRGLPARSLEPDAEVSVSVLREVLEAIHARLFVPRM